MGVSVKILIELPYNCKLRFNKVYTKLVFMVYFHKVKGKTSDKN